MNTWEEAYERGYKDAVNCRRPKATDLLYRMGYADGRRDEQRRDEMQDRLA